MRRACAVVLCLVAGVAHADPPSPDPVAEKITAFTEATSLLSKANAARARGNKNFAEQLFSSAELIFGPDAVAELAPLFREGAPPRVTTPLKQLPRDSAPQPVVVGNSDEEEKPEERPKRGSLSGVIKIDGKPLDGRGVVTLEPATGKFRHRAPRHRVMEQRNREFAPKILAVPVGSTVSFANFDAIYHNVFSRSDTQSFDLGIYKNGQSRDVTFEKEGILRLGCNLHANMAAYIVVVSAPHYAVTDDKGRFNFRSLEPGKYRVRAWSEKTVAPVVKELTIVPEKNTVELSVPADAPAGPSADKFGASRGH